MCARLNCCGWRCGCRDVDVATVRNSLFRVARRKYRRQCLVWQSEQCVCAPRRWERLASWCLAWRCWSQWQWISSASGVERERLRRQPSQWEARHPRPQQRPIRRCVEASAPALSGTDRTPFFRIPMCLAIGAMLIPCCACCECVGCKARWRSRRQ